MLKFAYAKELIKMYDDVNEFENLKKQYLEVVNGSIPDDIEEFKIKEDKINICDLLVEIGFATSKGEAKRMIAGKGVKINSNTVEDINLVVEPKDGVVIQFGKNKFKKVVKK